MVGTRGKIFKAPETIALFLPPQLCFSPTFTSSAARSLTSVSQFQERRNPSLKPLRAFLARRRRKNQKMSRKGEWQSQGFPVAVWSQLWKSKCTRKPRWGQGPGLELDPNMHKQVQQSVQAYCSQGARGPFQKVRMAHVMQRFGLLACFVYLISRLQIRKMKSRFLSNKISGKGVLKHRRA